MTGKKKSATPTSIAKWQARLDALNRKRYPHLKAGMTNTVWDDEIDKLEKLIVKGNKQADDAETVDDGA